jgi:hypothetical protein
MTLCMWQLMEDGWLWGYVGVAVQLCNCSCAYVCNAFVRPLKGLSHEIEFKYLNKMDSSRSKYVRTAIGF